MERDDDWPRDGERIGRGYGQLPERQRRRPPSPEDILPLPGRDDDWLFAAEQASRTLDHMDKLRASLSRAQTMLDGHHNALQRRLDEYPSLKKLYLSFVGANAGRTGKDFRKWIAAHGAATPIAAPRKLKVVVNNTQPSSKRVRLTMAARVRLKAELD